MQNEITIKDILTSIKKETKGKRKSHAAAKIVLLNVHDLAIEALDMIEEGEK